MIPCVTCGTHVRLGERGCPHCGSTLSNTVVRTAAAAMLGLSFAACHRESTNVDYGTSGTTDWTTDADTDADTDSDTDTDTDTDSDADSDTDTDADTDTGPTGTGTGHTGTP